VGGVAEYAQEAPNICEEENETSSIESLTVDRNLDCFLELLVNMAVDSVVGAWRPLFAYDLIVKVSIRTCFYYEPLSKFEISLFQL
jgi:hypothetical protein